MILTHKQPGDKKENTISQEPTQAHPDQFHYHQKQPRATHSQWTTQALANTSETLHTGTRTGSGEADQQTHTQRHTPVINAQPRPEHRAWLTSRHVWGPLTSLLPGRPFATPPQHILLNGQNISAPLPLPKSRCGDRDTFWQCYHHNPLDFLRIPEILRLENTPLRTTFKNTYQIMAVFWCRWDAT